jgi:ferredoxin
MRVDAPRSPASGGAADSLAIVGGRVALTVRLSVDRTACDGHGLCADLLPELVELDEWGYPILLAGRVPAELAGHARHAVRACPTLALRLQADQNSQTARHRWA